MPLFPTSSILISATVVILTTAFLRLLYVLPSIHPSRPVARKRGSPTRLLVVLGSGGHTSEMIAMLRRLDTSLYMQRSYVVSEGDDFSARVAASFENSIAHHKGVGPGGDAEGDNRALPALEVFDISVVPRARKIHQPLLTTPVSALRCLLACFKILAHPSTSSSMGPEYPDLILTNGPGTAVCVVLACLVTKFFGFKGTSGKMRTIYVESWARVKRLSLSGKILLWCVDRFLVQWEGLQSAGGRAEFKGVLV
ncbi:MAG: hypothetical protein M4579_001217 [Chaenotheca gracillima]|nr:MAG: hypothetical protein M4579_001217 [Chaenotheca gracillima]